MLNFKCREYFYDIKEARKFLTDDCGLKKLKTPRGKPEQFMGKTQCAKVEVMPASGTIYVNFYTIV